MLIAPDLVIGVVLPTTFTDHMYHARDTCGATKGATTSNMIVRASNRTCCKTNSSITSNSITIKMTLVATPE